MVQEEPVVVVNNSHLQGALQHQSISQHITGSHSLAQGSGAFGETGATTSTATGTKSGEACRELGEGH